MKKDEKIDKKILTNVTMGDNISERVRENGLAA